MQPTAYADGHQIAALYNILQFNLFVVFTGYSMVFSPHRTTTAKCLRLSMIQMQEDLYAVGHYEGLDLYE